MTTELSPRVLETPRAAGLAGIVFALLFGTFLLLVHDAVPVNPNVVGGWMTTASKRHELVIALYLVPFCGIAFLWFLGAVRSRIGAAEDRFLATVLMGSGFLFVGMLFVTAALFGALVTIAGSHISSISPGSWALGRSTLDNLASIYAMRMAAVFTMTASSIALRLRIYNRAVVALGYVTGILLLFASTSNPVIHMMFPFWVLVVSVNIVVVTFHQHAEGEAIAST